MTWCQWEGDRLSFLAKHYEKLILSVFLLIFVVALLYLVVVLNRARETSMKELMPSPKGKDYVRIFDKNGKEKVAKDGEKRFVALVDLERQQLWRKSVKRNSAALVSTDLLIPFEAARCPGCGKLIPSVCFGDGKKCPLCGCSLTPVKRNELGGQDSDNDGLSDAYEVKYKLNPQDPSDASQDQDEDGFITLYEYKSKTDPSDPASRPPLADRLAVTTITRRRLPLKFKHITTYDKKDKAKWMLQVEVPGHRGWKTDFTKVGDVLKFGKGGRDLYKIVDAEFKTVTNKAGLVVDASNITIQNMVDEKDKPIVVAVGKRAYENKVWVKFEDVATNKAITVKNGGGFSLGDAKTGKERYIVTGVDMAHKIVTIKSSKGVVYTITSISKTQQMEDVAPKPAEGESGGLGQSPSSPMMPPFSPTKSPAQAPKR